MSGSASGGGGFIRAKSVTVVPYANRGSLSCSKAKAITVLDGLLELKRAFKIPSFLSCEGSSLNTASQRASSSGVTRNVNA